MHGVLQGLRCDDIEVFLDGLLAHGRGRRRGSRCSRRTRDEYGRIARQFGRWLVRRGHLQENPWEAVVSIAVPGRDEVYVRRAVTMAEVHKLAQAAPQRAVLYYTAVTTGLRAIELRRLRWCDLDLDRCILHLPGYRDGQRMTKNGRDAILPLQPWLGDLLRGSFRRDPVFDMPRDMAPVIQEDARVAGVPLQDERGQVLDFHSLRAGTLHILLDLGVDVLTVGEIMRHAKLDTTLRHYRRNDVKRLADRFQVPDPRIA